MPKQNCVECGKEYIENVYHYREFGLRYDRSLGSYMCNDCWEANKNIGVVAKFDSEEENNFAEKNETYQQNCEEFQEKQKARELLKDEFQAKDWQIQELKAQLAEENQKNQILQQKLEKTLISLKRIIQEAESQEQQTLQIQPTYDNK